MILVFLEESLEMIELDYLVWWEETEALQS